jgi:hypothetical protein
MLPGRGGPPPITDDAEDHGEVIDRGAPGVPFSNKTSHWACNGGGGCLGACEGEYGGRGRARSSGEGGGVVVARSIDEGGGDSCIWGSGERSSEETKIVGLSGEHGCDGRAQKSGERSDGNRA